LSVFKREAPEKSRCYELTAMFFYYFLLYSNKSISI